MTKGKRGCFFWGCLALLGFVLAALSCGGLAAYGVYASLKSYTSETPADIPRYTPAEGECEDFASRLGSFNEALDAGEAAELVLSPGDLNAFFACEKGRTNDLAGRVFFEMSGSDLRIQTSLPLDEVPGFSGRFLNGTITLNVFLKNGILVATAKEMTVNGRPLPENFMEGLRKKNLAEKMMEDPELGKSISRWKTLEIEGGRMVIRG